MGDSMSFREKSAWITLVTTAGIYGVYFAGVGLGGPAVGFWGPFGWTISVLVLSQAALHSVAVMTAPREAAVPRDERERLIDLRSLRVGFYTAQSGLFGVLAALVWRADVWFVANALLLAMVLAEVARAGAAVVDFRRAAA